MPRRAKRAESSGRLSRTLYLREDLLTSWVEGMQSEEDKARRVDLGIAKTLSTKKLEVKAETSEDRPTCEAKFYVTVDGKEYLVARRERHMLQVIRELGGGKTSLFYWGMFLRAKKITQPEVSTDWLSCSDRSR